jgi:hypothetical protein
VGSSWIAEDVLRMEGRRKDCCGERKQREEAEDGERHLF